MTSQKSSRRNVLELDMARPVILPPTKHTPEEIARALLRSRPHVNSSVLTQEPKRPVAKRDPDAGNEPAPESDD